MRQFKASIWYICNVVTNVQVNHALELPFPLVSICNINGPVTVNNLQLSFTKFLGKNISKDEFEPYQDSFFGACIRFNAGRSANGSSLPVKFVYGRGLDNCLAMSFDATVTPLVWFTDETVDSSENEGNLFSPSSSFRMVLHRTSINKYPLPYSECTADLTREDSYDSELFRKSFKLKNTTSFHYNKCINLCKQKNLGSVLKRFVLLLFEKK